MDTTIARRRRLGEVRVFDPGGFLQHNQNPDIDVAPSERARWSPLRNAHTATGAKRAGEALAAWTPQAGVEGGMSFWTTQGKLLFTGLLGAAGLDSKRSMREVAQWVFNMSMPGDGMPACRPAEILTAAIDDPDPDRHAAAEAAILHLASIWNKPDPKIKASVYSTAVTVCDPWLDPHVVAATDLTDDDPGEWVDLDWLLDTGPDGNRANTLYLLVSNDDYKRLSPVLAGLLSDLKAQAYQWEMVGRRFPAPLLMLIDEAGNMPLDWLPEVSSTCAGIGIQLVTVWQSLAQIHEAYGRRADVLLTNHATKLFFPAASDDSTLGYQSKIVGDEEVERRSWSSDIGGGWPPVDLRAGPTRTARPLLPRPAAPLRAGADDPLQHPAGAGHRPPMVEDPPPRRHGARTPPRPTDGGDGTPNRPARRCRRRARGPRPRPASGPSRCQTPTPEPAVEPRIPPVPVEATA